MAERPATCSSCNKRLGKKQWYYRNGRYFCKKRCWKSASAQPEAAAAQPAS